MNAQQLIELVGLAEAQTGGTDELGYHRGFEPLAAGDQQQVKHGFLAVAQKQVLADHGAQSLFCLGQILHGARFGMLHLSIWDVQLFQQPIGAFGVSTFHLSFPPSFSYQAVSLR